jgi:hypothetical protein
MQKSILANLKSNKKQQRAKDCENNLKGRMKSQTEIAFYKNTFKSCTYRYCLNKGILYKIGLKD